MKVVGSALRDLVEDSTANAVLRRERGRRNLNFLHGLKEGVVDVIAHRQLDYASVLKVVRIIRQISIDRDGVSSVISAAALRDRLTGSAASPGEENIEVRPVIARNSGAYLG